MHWLIKRSIQKDLEFDAVLEDVETLNKWSFEKKLDITKLSYPAFFQNLDKYVLLNSGAALGKGVGPIINFKTNSQHSKFKFNKHNCLTWREHNCESSFFLCIPGCKE